MDMLFYFHLFLMFLFLTIPLWPYDFLKYGAYLPLVLTIIWSLNGSCPLNSYHKVKNSKGNFTLDILRIFIPNASEKFTNHITMVVLVLITIISFKRLCNQLI
jgi:hypothetical protein